MCVLESGGGVWWSQVKVCGGVCSRVRWGCAVESGGAVMWC